MRNTTDKKGHGFAVSMLVAVLVVGFTLLFLVLMAQAFCPVLPFLEELGTVGGILLLYIGALLVIGIAISVGAVVALYQRWKEIQGGEEDEAKKY
ncbi:MAG: hypothetical protein HFF50_05505 [Lawsonibacter sp.]|nr:hypothetical protein [Lawsonibacter sp.]